MPQTNYEMKKNLRQLDRLTEAAAREREEIIEIIEGGRQHALLQGEKVVVLYIDDILGRVKDRP